jgi:GINS complex subunit 4
MASGSTAGTDDDYEALISTTDVELLKRVWRNEKAAPEILRFQTALIQRTRGQIQLMVTSQTLKKF